VKLNQNITKNYAGINVVSLLEFDKIDIWKPEPVNKFLNF